MEAVGRLAGGIAHDFNNVLMVIRSSAAVAQRDAAPGSRTARCLDEIDQASERAAALTRQLLAFGRKQAISPKLVDLGALVAGLRPMLARILGDPVTLEIVPPPVPALAQVDPVQTEQVLLNLALNARDAMPRGGRVAIAVASAELDAACAAAEGVSPGPHVILTVADSGCGMSEDVRQRVFEPFFTTKEQGTGLGLSMVYGAVKQNRGAVHVESQTGRGTTFRIVLPSAGR